MKRIIRLTESDLARIVRRVIKEEGDSYDVIDLTQHKGTIQLLDGNGKDILDTNKVKYTSNRIEIVSKENLNFDENETITVKYFPDDEVNNGLTFRTDLGDKYKILNKSQNVTFVENPPSKGEIEFEFPVSERGYESIVLESKNLNEAKFQINVFIPYQGIVKKTNESYRRRYRRY